MHNVSGDNKTTPEDQQSQGSIKAIVFIFKVVRRSISSKTFTSDTWNNGFYINYIFHL